MHQGRLEMHYWKISTLCKIVEKHYNIYTSATVFPLWILVVCVILNYFFFICECA